MKSSNKIFQIIDNKCYWHTPFTSIEEAQEVYPPEYKFIDAPNWVQEGWGYDSTKEGEDRFIVPDPEEGYVWDENDHCFYSEKDLFILLQEAQLNKQNENKHMFSQWLNSHPLTWIDGKQYGVTMDDQSEIQLNLSQYQAKLAAGVENPILQWHSIHEACEDWTFENLTALVLAISDHIYPYFELMNSYKEKIFACTNHHEVPNIEICYSDDIKNNYPTVETPSIKEETTEENNNQAESSEIDEFSNDTEDNKTTVESDNNQKDVIESSDEERE